MRYFAVAATLLLSGCVSGSEYTLTTQARGDKSAIDAAAQVSLRDAESARYGDQMTFATNDFGFRRICGAVNAKNGFGGFTGFQPFKVLWKPSDPSFAPVMSAGAGAAIDCGPLFTS